MTPSITTSHKSLVLFQYENLLNIQSNITPIFKYIKDYYLRYAHFYSSVNQVYDQENSNRILDNSNDILKQVNVFTNCHIHDVFINDYNLNIKDFVKSLDVNPSKYYEIVFFTNQFNSSTLYHKDVKFIIVNI